ncbi:MAG: phytanoyl-CoA dioxygenase family protein [Candidatus Kapaibacterium sp.]
MNSKPQSFASDGYVVVEGILEAEQCGELIAALPPINSAGSRVLLFSSTFRDLARSLRNHSVLSEFIGDLVAVECILFRKSSAHNWGVPLHRDMVLPVKGIGSWESAGVKEGLDSVKPPREFLDRCVALRLQLDGAPVEDVSVVPGSHLDFLEGDRERAIAIPIEKGSALLMRPTLLHASTKLSYQGERRVLHFVFAPKVLPDGYSWHTAA